MNMVDGGFFVGDGGGSSAVGRSVGNVDCAHR
jgi:hypothetical protein